MIHQAVTYHFNVSKITISRLMIRLPQTSRTNDRPSNGRPHVTSQRQDRHLRLKLFTSGTVIKICMEYIILKYSVSRNSK